MASPASPLGRKPSVSIAEESPKAKIEATAPTSSATRIAPAEAEKQLLASIPAKEREIAKDWKVKQCVITKLDSGSAAPSNVPGMNVAPGAAGPPMIGKLKKMGTSKMHKFTPVVTLEQSIKWSAMKHSRMMRRTVGVESADAALVLLCCSQAV